MADSSIEIWSEGQKYQIKTDLVSGVHTLASNATATIAAGDIEIGAVELKNGADDTRAVIGANGLEVDVTNFTADANGNPQVTLMDSAGAAVQFGTLGTAGPVAGTDSRTQVHASIYGDNAGTPEAVDTNGAGALKVAGPLTDTELRAVAVPVSGTVTATGPLTDAELRATAVPVSGTVTATGPLTDTQLRATAVPVSIGSTVNVAVQNPAVSWSVSADYSSAQTNASVKAAPGAGSLYITDINISNGATAGNITLLDGSGGTVLFEIYPAINGGVSATLRNPIKLTATTALCITSTTVTTHSVNICGYTA